MGYNPKMAAMQLGNEILGRKKMGYTVYPLAHPMTETNLATIYNFTRGKILLPEKSVRSEPVHRCRC